MTRKGVCISSHLFSLDREAQYLHMGHLEILRLEKFHYVRLKPAGLEHILETDQCVDLLRGSTWPW